LNPVGLREKKRQDHKIGQESNINIRVKGNNNLSKGETQPNGIFILKPYPMKRVSCGDQLIRLGKVFSRIMIGEERVKLGYNKGTFGMQDVKNDGSEVVLMWSNIKRQGLL